MNVFFNAAPPLSVLLLGYAMFVGEASAWLLAACGLALVAVVVSAVHHAEVVAQRVGEPFGTLVLALAITVIEVALIVSLMLRGGEAAATLARDTLYATIMIVCNGVLGGSLVVGALAHREQAFQVAAVGPALAALVALGTMTLVLPVYTTSSPEGTYTASQLAFVAVVSLALWAVWERSCHWWARFERPQSSRRRGSLGSQRMAGPSLKHAINSRRPTSLGGRQPPFRTHVHTPCARSAGDPVCDTPAMTPTILLPGLACDVELFAHQRAALLAAGHAPVVSDAHFRFDTLSEMAAALLAEHGGALTLIGSSMGGMLALHAALAAPERVRRLVIIGSTARADTPELLALRSQAIEMFAAGRTDEVLRANLVFAFHPDHAARLAEPYFAMIRRAGADALIRQNRAVMARADLRPRLATIRCPTLVLAGVDDQITPPECAREIAAAIPGAQLVLLPRCGHLSTMEQPDEVTAQILRWLAETA